MREKVAEGAHPWIDSWNIALNSGLSFGGLGWNPNPSAVIYRGTGVPQNFYNVGRDQAAAYNNALRWHVTGDVQYAEKAIQIMNTWSSTLKGLEGSTDIALATGIHGYEFAVIGEMMRGYKGWKPDDIERLQHMLLTIFYPGNLNFLQGHFGTCNSHYRSNWDAVNIAALAAIGVFCDRRDIFDWAVNYFKVGVGNGSLNKLVNHLYDGGLAQTEEAGRDQGHAVGAMGWTAVTCQIAWNQGVDLYGLGDNRLMKGFEYLAKFNLGEQVPFTTYRTCTMNYDETGASDASRGRVDPIWEQVFNHYVNKRGLPATFTARYAAEKSRPEGGAKYYGTSGGTVDHLGYGSLVYSVDVPSTTNIPSIEAPDTIIAYKNWPFFYEIKNTNGATSYNVSGLPSDYQINTQNGTISGLATSLGIYRVTISAVNPAGTGSENAVLQVKLPPVPAITSVASLQTYVLRPLTFVIRSENRPTGFEAEGLPDGLALDTSTGVVTGAATVQGTYQVILKSINEAGTGTQLLTINVGIPSPPVISSETVQAYFGLDYQYAIKATNVPHHYAADGLPDGLVLNETTGVISGKPSRSGSFPVALTVLNSGGEATGILTIVIDKVAPAPWINTPVGWSDGGRSTYDDSTGSFTLFCKGRDIGGSLDGLMYVHQKLAGNKTIVARVTNLVPGRDKIDKVGLLMRSSTWESAQQVGLILGAAYGSSMVNRTSDGGGTSITGGPGFPALPVWLKLERRGSSFTGYVSADGINWDPVAQINNNLPDDAYEIGMAVCSRNQSYINATTFDRVRIYDTEPALPAISSAKSLRANILIPFTYKLTAINNPVSYGVANLPAGLTYNNVNQTISGSPAMPGIYNIEIHATNANGTVSRNLILNAVSLKIPGVVEMEEYDEGGSGVGYFDTTNGNVGGIAYRNDNVDIRTTDVAGNYAIGTVANGEWLRYTVDVQQQTSYVTKLRYAAPNTTINGLFRLKVDGITALDSIKVTSTGNWNNWREMTLSLPTLSPGKHVIEFYIVEAGFDLDKLTFDMNPNPLPVTLIGFSAQASPDGNILRWVTSSEENNAGFYIESSENGRVFKSLGYVDGQGKMRQTQSYSFIDAKPEAHSYYRLKQTDVDGKYSYSRIVFISAAELLKIRVFPNPVNGIVTLQNPTDNKQFKIQDTSGHIIESYQDFKELTYDTSHLKKGLYLITLGTRIFKVIVD